jgi:gliding motility-associated-like protein
LYNGFTCVTARVRVLNDCVPVIFAPNAFTPNGDGLNDSFSIIPSAEVQEFRIVISNRWGEPVFQSDDKNFAWDGTLDGDLLPPGTYAYKMTFSSTVDASIGTQEQFGSILLLR